MPYSVPEGFRIASVHCGLKSDGKSPDLVVVTADQACSAAGVYTQNLVRAAAVEWDEQITPAENVRGVVINSGNANACTGDQGAADNEQMATTMAHLLGGTATDYLVLSTGIIGEPMPMEKVVRGIHAAVEILSREPAVIEQAARGMMTTDRAPKIAAANISGGAGTIVGLAKGAGMIGPNMATMLGVLLTDAAIPANQAQTWLAATVENTFNCISVEGHTSTNDSVLLLSSGRVNLGEAIPDFAAALESVCGQLARSIPSDGEGASHLITICITGASTDAAARKIVKAVAHSALVKTAVAGADPNWGRIVSAVGMSGVPLDPAQIRLQINGTLLFANGTPVKFDASSVSRSLANNHETRIDLVVGTGPGRVRFWTSDLTLEYVRINSEYHT